MKIIKIIIALLVLSGTPAVGYADQILLRVGYSLPLSGRLAHVGSDIRQGVELAASDLKSESRGFELIFDDNQHLQTHAVSSAKKLIHSDKVDVLVSLWDMADVIAPITEQYQVPHIAIRWNPYVTQDHLYTITLETTYESYIDSQIKLIQSLGAKTVGLITEENQGWIIAAEYFEEAIKQTNLKLAVKELLTADATDYRSTITRALAKNPDIVVILANPPHNETIAQRIREQKSGQHITGYFENVQHLERIEGLPFVAQFSAESWFRRRFKAAYGRDFITRAPFGYDTLVLIARAQKHSEEKLHAAELLRELLRTKNVHGASGLLNSNSASNIENKPVWQIVRNGKLSSYIIGK